MKLVEILARELEEWADTTSSYTQDGCRTVWPWTGSSWPEFTTSWEVMPSATIDQNGEARTITPHDLADDYATAIITREIWQAERDRIAAAEKPKEAKWIRHRGGKCPVEAGVRIDVRHRDGETFESVVVGEHYCCNSWTHYDTSGDIMAWRPSIIEEEKQEMEDPAKVRVGKDVTVEYSIDGETWNALGGLKSISVVESGPLDWRDRIREIDAQHIALTNERAELVAKLAAEGLALCGEPVKAAAPAEDMSDPVNWQVGDQVEIKVSDNPGWVKFKGVTGQLENDGDWWISFPDDGVWYVSDNTTVKWRSRP